ncbi:unnamed protein product [Bursaphelenchus okinawaensis]|uniref:Uncharacterized protein n=1 Tax=Bursaphelenchus okinawaensis TaxID=465554 RepID=A0A811LNJ8_9BILA|nr:unnamed protein product [Bursaphelenchus okinawaensis]CAG9126366.1 unnamed protein product [Bursaphelenchus okinawaensis]
METKQALERRILLIGSYKKLLFDSLCAAAERYERHVQYHDVYYLYFKINENTIIIELTLAGTEHTGAREMAIRNSDGVIICYAANYPASFNELASLNEDFKMRKNKNAPILLVRNEDEYVELDPVESSSSQTGSSDKDDISRNTNEQADDENKTMITSEQDQELAKELNCETMALKLSEAGPMDNIILDFVKKVLDTDRRQRRRSTLMDGLKHLNVITLNKLRKSDKDSSSHSSTSDISPEADQENVDSKSDKEDGKGTKEKKCTKDDKKSTKDSDSDKDDKLSVKNSESDLETRSTPATPSNNRSFLRTFKRNQTAPSSQKGSSQHSHATTTQSKVCAVM